MKRDYTAMLFALMPRGIIWRRLAGSRLEALLQGHAAELSRVDGEGQRLMVEADPQSTVEAISDWERLTGLPDACTSPADTLAQRRAQVIAKLVRPVGQNVTFFEELATSLGYSSPCVEVFPPFCADESGADDRLNDAPGGASLDSTASPSKLLPSLYDGWRFVWLLHVGVSEVREFGCDESGAEDYLRIWGNAKLECLVRRAAPAHTWPLFGYGTPQDQRKCHA